MPLAASVTKFFLALIRRIHRRRPAPDSDALSAPDPLPTDRINIREAQKVAQQPNCPLLCLPPELRELVYDTVLGGRLVDMELVPEPELGRLRFRTVCYPLSEEANTPALMDVPTNGIPVAFLLSCRQVYLEALPTLHQRNRFYFRIQHFKIAVLCGFGPHWLPEIRNLYLLHIGGIHRTVWNSVFPLLAQTSLDCLTIEFDPQSWLGVNIRARSLNFATQWRRGLRGVRGLRHLEILFREGTPDSTLYGPPPPRETIETWVENLYSAERADRGGWGGR
ncbi:hypothetical protein C8J57DRAFT_170187 [Mycena rebaudengoi]|nr:hypothetical protein C8J57DRAFT_170187 [Mycena rebaudengoi]